MTPSPEMLKAISEAGSTALMFLALVVFVWGALKFLAALQDITRLFHDDLSDSRKSFQEQIMEQHKENAQIAVEVIKAVQGLDTTVQGVVRTVVGLDITVQRLDRSLEQIQEQVKIDH